jgi:hypothetical protein
VRSLRETLPVLVLVGVLAGCSDGDRAGSESGPSPTGLAAYTDPGDGCAQAVSAISYADDLLKPLGQEPYQDWDDAVRSRVAAVDGTIALEVQDFPDDEVLAAARRVQERARSAAAPDVSGEARVRWLREYRRDAASLTLLCAPYVDPSASPDASSR